MTPDAELDEIELWEHITPDAEKWRFFPPDD